MTREAPVGRVHEIVRLELHAPQDLHEARRRAMRLSKDIGFSPLGCVQVCTALSEIVRNVLLYAKHGLLTMRATRRGIHIEVFDRGPGIPLEHLDAIEGGTYRSKTGMGKGIHGARQLMDRFELITLPGSTQVFMEKYIGR